MLGPADMPKIIEKLKKRGGGPIAISHAEADLLLLALGVVTVGTRKNIKDQYDAQRRVLAKKERRLSVV